MRRKTWRCSNWRYTGMYQENEKWKEKKDSNTRIRKSETIRRKSRTLTKRKEWGKDHVLIGNGATLTRNGIINNQKRNGGDKRGKCLKNTVNGIKSISPELKIICQTGEYHCNKTNVDTLECPSRRSLMVVIRTLHGRYGKWSYSRDDSENA